MTVERMLIFFVIGSKIVKTGRINHSSSLFIIVFLDELRISIHQSY